MHLSSSCTDKMTEKTSSNPLEQFVLLAKTAKGTAAVELIKQALEVPGVYVFGELLDMPNVRDVSIHYVYMIFVGHVVFILK